MPNLLRPVGLKVQTALTSPGEWMMPGPGGAVSAVLKKLKGLDAAETASITTFVNGMLFDGVWRKVTEVYCPALNATDFLTSWFHGDKLVGLVSNPGDHVKGVGVRFLSDAQFLFEPRNFDTFAKVESFAGAFVHFESPPAVTSSSDYFGLNSVAEGEAAYSWRGTDTFDMETIWNVTLSTPRGTISERPDNDFVGLGLNGIEVTYMGSNAEIVSRDRVPNASVPRGFPMQWFGQNRNGVISTNEKDAMTFSFMLHMNGQTIADMLSTRLRVLTLMTALGVPF